jgi:hypothetical protein
MLYLGVRMAAPAINEKIGSGPVTIVVTDLKYRDNDFQAEGLTFAMLGWLTDAFDLNTFRVVVSFDRAANRYNFTLS